jgi:lipoprotein LprG
MTKRIGMLGRAMAVTLTAAVMFGAGGCGDQGGSGPGYASKDNVVEPGDSDAPLTQDEIISVSYQAAMEAGSAHMSMTMKGAASMTAEGDMTYEAGASDMRMTTVMPHLGKGKFEIRVVDKVVYIQLPGMTAPGKFVAIDPKDQGSPLAKGFAGLTEQMDPLASVKSMEAAVTKVDRVGVTKVDGAQVDHYRVAVDTAQMMKDLKQPNTPGMPESLTYDMWLDDDNLMRKMAFDVSGAQVEMLLTDWGQPVHVERPAAGDIVKAPGV